MSNVIEGLGDVDACAKRLLEAAGDETWEDVSLVGRDYWSERVHDVLNNLVVDDAGEVRDGRTIGALSKWMERARDAEVALDKARGALVASEAAFAFVKLYQLLADPASENYALLALRPPSPAPS